MAEQQLIDYIRTSQASGMSLDIIKQDLLSAGWTQDQIDEAFRVVNVPKPSVPVPLSVSVTQTSSVPKKRYTSPYSGLLAVVLVVSLLILAQNAVTDILDRFAPSEDNYYKSQEYNDYQKDLSDYEVKNRVTYSPSNSDSYYEWNKQRTIKMKELDEKYRAQYKTHSVSPSFRMILNAIIVLPFWIITFVLFIFLKEERRKHEALLGSYYVTSGWLLIFLFFNVAQYIWRSNTVIGVYVVLGMLVAILTGAIWGVQKYRHSLGN
ncbi:MAG: hypothetical protein Q8P69_00370 [bacterium]|nr:hypothetical protein [bacterium]